MSLSMKRSYAIGLKKNLMKKEEIIYKIKSRIQIRVMTMKKK